MQKLESLCRALQDERKSLFQKLQEKQEPTAVEDNHNATVVQSEDEIPVTQAEETKEPKASVTPITKEIATLKAEKSRLEEIATCFKISHISEQIVLPDESSEVSQQFDSTDSVQNLIEPTEVSTDLEFHLDELTIPTKTMSDECQEMRNKEMETVD